MMMLVSLQKDTAAAGTAYRTGLSQKQLPQVGTSEC